MWTGIPYLQQISPKLLETNSENIPYYKQENSTENKWGKMIREIKLRN